MVKVDARGDACPLPVVKAKKALSELNGTGEVEVLVDNEIAVQNLTKMAQQRVLPIAQKNGPSGNTPSALRWEMLWKKRMSLRRAASRMHGPIRWS